MIIHIFDDALLPHLSTSTTFLTRNGLIVSTISVRVVSAAFECEILCRSKHCRLLHSSHRLYQFISRDMSYRRMYKQENCRISFSTLVLVNFIAFWGPRVRCVTWLQLLSHLRKNSGSQSGVGQIKAAQVPVGRGGPGGDSSHLTYSVSLPQCLHFLAGL